MNAAIPEETPQPYALYHAKSVVAMIFPNPQGWLTNREQNYEHVANIFAPRSRIFAIANRQDGHEWTEQPEVFWVAEGDSPRSMCVGDVIYSPSTKRAWLMGHAGLQEIQTEVDGV